MHTYRGESKTVHEVLARSYLSFFVFCTIGIFFDLFFPLNFFVPSLWIPAVSCLVVGPAIIAWAQYSSHHFAKDLLKGKKLTVDSFMNGPYQFVRNPTQIGLVILVLGYSLITSSAMLFAATLIAVLISNYYFRTHEKILEDKYGEPYKQYKKAVPLIM